MALSIKWSDDFKESIASGDGWRATVFQTHDGRWFGKIDWSSGDRRCSLNCPDREGAKAFVEDELTKEATPCV